MELNEYYLDELQALKHEGSKLGEKYPHLASMLGEHARDPDIGMLLEGFAFLIARMRKRLEDDYPELYKNIIEMIWPRLLRPNISMTIIRFQGKSSALSTSVTVPRFTHMDSRDRGEGKCRFSTVYETKILPIEIEGARLSQDGTGLFASITFTSGQERPVDYSKLPDVILFIDADWVSACEIFHTLMEHSTTVEYEDQDGRIVGVREGREVITVDPNRRHSIGPMKGNVNDGYSVLEKYFIYPESLLFFQLTLDPGGHVEKFSRLTVRIKCSIGRRIVIPKSKDILKLHCVPAINVYPLDATPVRRSPAKHEYDINLPSRGVITPIVYSILSVVGWDIQKDRKRTYRDYLRFNGNHMPGMQANNPTFVIHQSNDGHLGKRHSSIRFGDYPSVSTEVISIKTLATDGEHAANLPPGSIIEATENSPEFATFENIRTTSNFSSNRLSDHHAWSLISRIQTRMSMLETKADLASVIRLFSGIDERDMTRLRYMNEVINSITDIHLKDEVRFVDSIPVLGKAYTLVLGRGPFTCLGEVYMFAEVLAVTVLNSVSLNSPVRVKVICEDYAQSFCWDSVSWRHGNRMTSAPC